jgi:tRNA(Ile)-lysidine synthase
MANILQTLDHFFSLHDNRNIAVAYSGGVDSQVLLHGLCTLRNQHKIKQNIQVYHVNHGLSHNADDWQKFALQQCQALNVSLTICSVNIKIEARQSLEEKARVARYEALQSACDPTDIIVTGHHSDDQAETFLLALKRGSGVKGLSAMPGVNTLGEQLLARPLLSHSRAEIEQYAQQNQLTWIDDESNLDINYDRNFLRHHILPLLQKRWPGINDTLGRSAQHCAQAQTLADELAQQDLQLVQTEKFSLSVDALSQLSIARFNNVIRYFLQQHQVLMPSSKQLQQIHNQLNASIDKNPAVQLAQHCVRRFQGALHLTAIFADVSQWQQLLEWPANINKNHTLTVLLPDNIGQLAVSSDRFADNDQFDWCASIIAPKLDQQISVRFSHQNPRCLPAYRQHSRSVKKVLQELNIPIWQRRRLPFLFYNDELVAVIGHFVCKPYLVDDQAKAIKVYWKMP